MEKWISVKDAAVMLDITERTIIKRIHEGKIKAEKDGKSWRVDAESIPNSFRIHPNGNGVEMIGISVPAVLHERMKEHAATHDVSILDFITEAIESALNGEKQSSDEPSGSVQQAIDTFREQILTKDEQISSLHQQIDQLHQLLAMKEKVTAELMAERKALNFALEHQKKPWYVKMVQTLGNKRKEEYNYS